MKGVHENYGTKMTHFRLGDLWDSTTIMRMIDNHGRK